MLSTALRKDEMTSAFSAPAPESLPVPRDLATWTRRFAQLDIPVLSDTADALEAFRANEDRIDANSLGEMIAGDPLMTLKVLAYESGHRGRRVVTSAETVVSALVMMGISPFFRAFGTQRTVEELLADRPEAMAGMRRVLLRAHRAADFALAFAVHRTDPGAAVIHAAALLHEFAELLLWCHAPEQALRIEAMQAADPELRSNLAQRTVLGIELADLQQALAAHWHLPALLAESTSVPKASGATSARIVFLAARLARHAAHDWDNPAIPDDVAEIAVLLNLSPQATLSLLQGI
jgi:HD-like signal output (HDOD) protein